MDQPPSGLDRPARFRLLVVLPLLAAGLIWTWWPSLRDMVNRWSDDPRYSHGFLVPVFALFLLWTRRGELAARPLDSNAWGVGLIAAGAAAKLAAARYYLPWFEAASLLPCLAGLALLVGGRTAFAWAGPAVAFLLFMIPLPYRVEMALGYPLQRVATVSSNYALQTMGMPAVAEGNIILLDDIKIGVVEACNGLGMLFTFVAFAVGVALVIRRPLLDKVILILSAAPIALLANVTRITVTGVLYKMVSNRVADAVYHDLAGWLMMPLALVAIWAELLLLQHLFVEPAAPRPRPVGL